MELKERALVNDSGNFLELRVVGIANQEALNGHTSHAVAMDKQGFVSAYELEGRSQEIVVLVHLPARSSRAVWKSVALKVNKGYIKSVKRVLQSQVEHVVWVTCVTVNYEHRRQNFVRVTILILLSRVGKRKCAHVHEIVAVDFRFVQRMRNLNEFTSKVQRPDGDVALDEVLELKQAVLVESCVIVLEIPENSRVSFLVF